MLAFNHSCATHFRSLSGAPTCKNIITVIGSGSTCMSVSSSEYSYSQCDAASPYCAFKPPSYQNEATCSATQKFIQAQTNLPNGSACSASSECLSQNCLNLICTQGTLANGQACNHRQQCSSTTCFNGTCKESKILGQECQAGQCSSAQKCLPLGFSFVTSGTCQTKITSGQCLYQNQCANGYYCDTSKNCSPYPTSDPSSCASQFDCPINKYCNLDSKTCQARVQSGSCDLQNSSCTRSKYCSNNGTCQALLDGQACSYNRQCKSGYCDSDCYDVISTSSCGIDEGQFCSGNNYCHPSAAENVRTFNTCQFPIVGSCTTDSDCSSTQYCDSTSGCTDLKDTDSSCTDDKQCKGLCLSGSCKALGSLSLGTEAGGKHKLCKSGYIPASSTTCGSLSRSSSQSLFCDTANKCNYTDNKGSTVQLDCRCGGNGGTPAFNGHCPNYRGTHAYQQLIEHANDLGVLKNEHFDDPYLLGVPLIGIDVSIQKNLFTVVRFMQVSFLNFYASDELFLVKNNFQNVPNVKDLPQKGIDLMYLPRVQLQFSGLTNVTNTDINRVFLSSFMTEDELNAQVGNFNILLTKTNAIIDLFKTQISTFANKYIALSQFTCENTNKIIQVLARLYLDQIINDRDYSQTETLFDTILNKGSGCAENSQMQSLKAQIVGEKIKKLQEAVSITSNIEQATDLALTVQADKRSLIAQVLEKYYAAYIYQVLENFQATRLLQQQGDARNSCTLNEQVQFIYGKFKPLTSKLLQVNNGLDLTNVFSKATKLAGIALDFSPYQKHILSSNITAEVKSNPGGSYPALAIDLAPSKCDDIGTLPPQGCGVNYQNSTQWKVKRSNSTVIAPVNATYSSSTGFQYNIDSEVQFALYKVSKLKPICCVKLTSNNQWVKTDAIPQRSSSQKFTCQANQAGFVALIYYEQSRKVCLDYDQALALKIKRIASDLVDILLRQLRLPWYSRQDLEYTCDNCYDWSKVSKKGAQILIDQRSDQPTLRNQLCISFYYSLTCWCRGYSLSHSQRIQVIDNMCFFLRQICYSFMRQWHRILTVQEVYEQMRQIQENSISGALQYIKSLQTQYLTVEQKKHTSYGGIMAQLAGNVPLHLQTNLTQDQKQFIDNKVDSYFITSKQFYKALIKSNEGDKVQSVHSMIIIEPFNKNFTQENHLMYIVTSAFDQNNIQIENTILPKSFSIGYQYQNYSKYNDYFCTIVKNDQNKVVIQETTNIKTKIDSEKGIIQCQSNVTGVIAIKEIYKFFSWIIFTIIIIAIVSCIFVYALIYYMYLRKQKTSSPKIQNQSQEQQNQSQQQQNQSLQLQSKPQLQKKKSLTVADFKTNLNKSGICIPHISKSCNSRKAMLFMVFLYSYPPLRWVLNFQSKTYAKLLLAIKMTQTILRLSLITLTIAFDIIPPLYWTITVLATYCYSPLQQLLFQTNKNSKCSEIVDSSNQKQVSTPKVKKFLAIIGIVISQVVSLMLIVLSIYKVYVSKLESQKFYQRVIIAFVLGFVFSFIQAVVLTIINCVCKDKLLDQNQNRVAKFFYRILVGKDVRLIFEDQEMVYNKLVLKNDKIHIVKIVQPQVQSYEENKLQDLSQQGNENSAGGMLNKSCDLDTVRVVSYNIINQGRSQAPMHNCQHRRLNTQIPG